MIRLVFEVDLRSLESQCALYSDNLNFYDCFQFSKK